jgi:hypothetical protein
MPESGWKSPELLWKSLERMQFMNENRGDWRDLNKTAFNSLFRDACEKCFGLHISSALSETESKILSNKIYEQTGLVIGPKSIKNYSIYLFEKRGSTKENPSDATLDTLARYVLGAPHTTELQRKNNENHYPYWFQYRNGLTGAMPARRKLMYGRKKALFLLLAVFIVVITIFIIDSRNGKNRSEVFADDFNSVERDSLEARGWMIKSEDPAWWKRRNERPGHLTLFTLKGDNWKNEENPAGIKNLLMRRIYSSCFMAEIHLTGFIPRQNWQQAGILLSEDSTLSGKALRLSLSYNDFFGGYQKPAEIIIQAVSCSESGILSKPEEIAHIPLFSIEPDHETLVMNNLATSALKIEKRGELFRFLYTTGPGESFAFKEVVSGKFDLQPRYISLFAIQGWARRESVLPASFDSFAFATISCNE